MKTLSAVEADPSRSHQHEFNEAKDLMMIFGEAREKQTFEALYIYLSDGDDELRLKEKPSRISYFRGVGNTKTWNTMQVF